MAIAIVFLLLACAPSRAGLIRLDSANGNTDVDPNDPTPVTPYVLDQGAGQIIYIYASGGDLIQSASLNVQVGLDDGSIVGPKITAVDLKGISDGTQNGIFDSLGSANTHYSLNTGAPGFSPGDTATRSQFWSAYIVSDTTPVPLGTTVPQLLAVVTLDTTGLAQGSTFDLKLDSPNDPSAFAASDGSTVGVTIVDGLITIGAQAAPEPASLGLIGISAFGLLLRRRRNFQTPASLA